MVPAYRSYIFAIQLLFQLLYDMLLNYRVDSVRKIEERMGDVAANIFKAAHTKSQSVREKAMAFENTIEGILEDDKKQGEVYRRNEMKFRQFKLCNDVFETTSYI